MRILLINGPAHGRYFEAPEKALNFTPPGIDALYHWSSEITGTGHRVFRWEFEGKSLGEILPDISPDYGRWNFESVKLPPHLRHEHDPRPCVGCGESVDPRQAVLTHAGGWHGPCHGAAVLVALPGEIPEAPYFYAWQDATRAVLKR